MSRTTLVRFFLCFLALIALILLIGCIVHLKLGAEGLNAWGAYLSGCATLLLSLAAIVTGAQGLKQYRAKISGDKAKWLFQLYEKLFEHTQYKDVRRKLDYDDTAEIKSLIAKDKNGQAFQPAERVAFDVFTDYLNFFEMIAHLREAGQLTSSDIRATFDYYLRLLTKRRNPEIREYLKKDGFESLDKLLLEYEGQEPSG
jgi:hypothetical protein